MHRPMAKLSILLALQVALALLLASRRDPLAGTHLDTPLVPANAAKSADRLIIEGKDSKPGTGVTRVELAKRGGSWVLPGEFDAPADATRVESLLDQLSALKRGLPIATSDAALKRFKVADDDFERRVMLTASGKALDTLYFGDSPGLRKSDARAGSEHAVYAVDLPTYQLPTDAASWLDADVLHDDVKQLDELDVAGANGDRVELLKQKGADKQPPVWTDPKLTGDKHIDNARAEALADQLSQLRVDGVLGTDAKPEWQQDHPLLTLALKDDKAHDVDWTLSKPSSGDFYVLKSSAHPWYFSLNASAAKAMIEAGDRDQLLGVAKPLPKSRPPKQTAKS